MRIYQFLAIGLVYPIFHRLVDEFGIGRVCGEGGGEDGEPLHIEYLQGNLLDKVEGGRGGGTYEVLS